MKATMPTIPELFYQTVDEFNMEIGTSFSPENVLLFTCTAENGVDVYEQICTAHFPRHLEEDYTTAGFIEGFAAMALLGEETDGVLIREDVDFTLYEWHHTMLHELAHIFVSRNEISGNELFYDKYCLHSDSGDIIAGYAIWRELIAEIIAMDSDCFMGKFSIDDLQDELRFLDGNINAENPESKIALYRLLSYLFKSEEYYTAADEDSFILQIQNHTFLTSYESIIRLVYGQFRTDDAIKIEPEFVQELGCQYLLMLAMKRLHSCRDDKNSDGEASNE